MIITIIIIHSFTLVVFIRNIVAFVVNRSGIAVKLLAAKVNALVRRRRRL